MEFANVSEEGVKNSHGQLNEHNYAAKNARRKLETRSADMFSRTSTSFNRKLDFLLRLARSEALSVRSMPASDTVLSVRVHQPLVNDRADSRTLPFELRRLCFFPNLYEQTK